ncbi:DUF1538 domain-containing protein [uncultured Treponema sp.]|uniref:DUF1538 domain-containing protein n=1 Tax=uncultured Treponema sp. TaxID=162155 RepID=UPI0025D38064|nr:DUF1538 domain-containing protein [uncultured Treponema sp.]
MDIFQKFKETVSSVLPIMLMVILLGLTVAPMPFFVLTRFVLGGILVIVGLTIFLLGVDIGILPIGERSGAALTAKRSLPLLLAAAFLIGFIVTVAEPDVQVLADQVKGIAPQVSKWGLILMIGVGVGLFVALGILRTVLSIPLNILLTISYIAVFALAFLAPATFQGVAFDSGGATTGPMTVPFIMALGVGVAAVRSKSAKNGKLSSSSDDSFGLTGIASVGPVLAVIIYGIVLNGGNASDSESLSAESAHSLGQGIFVFLNLLPSILKEVSAALAPLVAMAAVFQLFLLKMPPMQVVRMIRGFVLSFVGLILFLTGAQGGFMPAGEALGEVLGVASRTGAFWTVLLVAVGFVFGAIVVCAEPAVWVLTDQVESISGGTIKRKVMLVALSSGVALSIGISMLRVLFAFSLWYILIPGYALALLLSFISPKLFTGIAFDSGGVASGPMTSTFVLSFTLGASSASGGNPAVDAFGVIALVAMTPLIAIQILGIIFRIKTNRSEKAKIGSEAEK